MNKLFDIIKTFKKKDVLDIADFLLPIFIKAFLSKEGLSEEVLDSVNNVIGGLNLYLAKHFEYEEKSKTFLYDEIKNSKEVLYKELEASFDKNGGTFNKKTYNILSKAIIECIDDIDKLDYPSDSQIAGVASKYILKIDDREEKEVLNEYLILVLKFISEEIEIDEHNSVKQVKINSITKEKIECLEVKVTELDKRVSVIENEKKPKVESSESDFEELYNGYAFLDDVKGKEIRVGDIYVTPKYYENLSEEPLDDLDDKIKSFLKNEGNIFLPVFGVPGIGKSTFIAYLLYSEKFEIPCNFKVYKIKKFSCFKDYNEINDLPNKILDEIALEEKDLSNELLILDGLDEVDLGEGGQALLINEIQKKWIKNKKISNFRMIITCRTARISSEDLERLRPDYITLAPFSKDEINTFIEQYTDRRNEIRNPVNDESINSIKAICDDENDVSEVVSIPLILYMIIGLGIKVKEKSDLISIYNQIFSVDNKRSIYNHAKESDRDIDVKKTWRKKIHNFSKLAAVEMWKTNPEEAILTKEEYTKIANEVDPNGSVHNLFSGQYFVEGSESKELYFVHRSIYEYFVALTYFEKICKIIEILPIIEEKYNSNCVSKFFDFVLISHLSKEINNEIREYLIRLFKDSNYFKKLNEKNVKNFFDTFFEKGLPANMQLENRLESFNLEAKLFFYMVYVFRMLLASSLDQETFSIISEDCINYYTMCNRRKTDSDLTYILVDLSYINLKNMNLGGVDLREGNLSGADLSEGFFSGADLRGADLGGADLNETDLSGADLSDAKLNIAYLRGTDLSHADLSRANLRGADLRRGNLRNAYLRGTDLREGILRDARLSGANLSGADLRGADLSHVDLSFADLTCADLREGILSGANLSGADLRGADLLIADLSRVDLCGSNLRGADLTYADVSGAYLSGADLRGANLSLVDFSNVKLIGANIYNCIATEGQKKYVLDRGAVEESEDRLY